MSAVAQAMLILFILAGGAGLISWLYATRHWFDRREGHLRKSIVGCGLFVLAIGAMFAAGSAAEYWGGGWG